MVLEIDAIYFLAFIELFVLVFALMLFFFIRAKKFKKLASGMLLPEPAPAIVEEVVQPEPEPLPEPEPVPEPVPVIAEPAPDAAEELPSDVARLRELLLYQKDVIVELMGYKEILEGANKRLRSLMDLGGDIQEGVMMLLGALPPSDEQTSTFKKFEQSEMDLNSVIKTVDKQNEALSAKFSEWDEKFKNLMSGELAMPAETTDVSGRIAELEADVVAKDKEISKLKQQYEGLETEYLHLYRQHHGSDKPKQPDI
ncbi:MAG: hypothetical protein JXR79_06710 [Nitrospirae bacterium]|nr:hypothetical protein [Nitrospirota bacterium]